MLGFRYVVHSPCESKCSGNGRCINNRCACNEGYSGLACGKLSCPQNCRQVAWLALLVVRGLCQEYKARAANLARCVIKHNRLNLTAWSLNWGFTVRACSNDHGSCSRSLNRCVCEDGWTGPSCETPTVDNAWHWVVPSGMATHDEATFKARMQHTAVYDTV